MNKHQWGTFFKDGTLYRTYETARQAENAANRAAGRGKMLYTKPLTAAAAIIAELSK